MIQFKKFNDIDLYDYLYQKGINEVDIPKTRKSRLKLCKKVITNPRRQPIAGSTLPNRSAMKDATFFLNYSR